MAYPLMTQTLPTIVGMGVVTRATEVSFGRGGRGRSGTKRPVRKGKPNPKGMVYLATKDTKTEAEKFARKWQRSHPRTSTRITKFHFTGMGRRHTAYNVWAVIPRRQL